MTWNLKEYGENLEREASEFISIHIPCYERTWSIFIGHKGNGQMADASGISLDADKMRKQFAEHHYTILESIFLMYRIALREQNIKVVTNFDEYCTLLDNTMAFYAHSGRIRD